MVYKKNQSDDIGPRLTASHVKIQSVACDNIFNMRIKQITNISNKVN
jgi:hypothetical protein